MNLQRLSPKPSGQGSRATIDTQQRFRKRIVLNAEMVSRECGKRQSTNGKEFDTYKVGTVSNSTSTMHKIHSTAITDECFSFDEDLYDVVLFDNAEDGYDDIGWAFKDIITICEILRKRYMETKDKRYWRALIQILPNGWNQTRTISLNYAVLRGMYFQRRNHKLTEWHDFCHWVESLPYAKELICYEKKEN